MVFEWFQNAHNYGALYRARYIFNRNCGFHWHIGRSLNGSQIFVDNSFCGAAEVVQHVKGNIFDGHDNDERLYEHWSLTVTHG